MIQDKQIKAILFDSGGVLNQPRTGHWFIPPNFFKFVNRQKFLSLDQKLIERAFYLGHQYSAAHLLIRTEAEEFNHFIEFYRIIAKELPILELSEAQIVAIARDCVYNDDKFYFPEDVFEVIPRLSHNYLLGVVSNTWPSLERVFRNVGLRKYFGTFVMSSVLGVEKPERLLYDTALSELGVLPEESLFIDDNLGNVAGAKRIGMQAMLMLRGKESSKDTDGFINNLRDLEKIMGIEY